MKKLGMLALTATLFATSAFADGNQVFYRFGQTKADDAPAAGADDKGKAVGAGLAMKLMNCPMFEGNSLLGEILVDYNKFSNKGNVTRSELQVAISPKYRFELGKVRPWVTPIGMAFMVNSPPQGTGLTYLDVGYHFAAGVEYMIAKEISLGVDVRRTVGTTNAQYAAKFTSYAAYLGINF